MCALLNWYVAAGISEATDTEPRDRFQATPLRKAVVASAPAAKPLESPATAREKPRDTVEIATACSTLAELRATIDAFDGCALKRTATNTVVGNGDEDAALMVIGEAPGAEEDRQGLPFVGPAGQLLNRMLASINLKRQTVYVSNILPWRPPGNRSPTAEEIALCQPFIERQIALVGPRVLILVGGISAKSLLNEKQGITRLRGTWRELTVANLADPVATMATFHPAYLLRQPAAKREAWRDLLAVQKKLQAPNA